MSRRTASFYRILFCCTLLIMLTFGYSRLNALYCGAHFVRNLVFSIQRHAALFRTHPPHCCPRRPFYLFSCRYGGGERERDCCCILLYNCGLAILFQPEANLATISHVPSKLTISGRRRAGVQGPKASTDAGRRRWPRDGGDLRKGTHETRTMTPL